MKKYLLYILITAFAIKANAQNGFQRTAKGTQYQMLTHNPGDRIKVGDIVTFNVVQKTEKDSVLYSSYQMGKPVQMQVQAAGDLMDIMPLLTVKDSVLIRVPTDTIFKTQEDKRPPFLPKGSNLFFVLKVEKIQSLAEAMAERDKAVEAAKAEAAKMQAQEGVNTDKYLAEHKMVLTTTASGLKYKITKAGFKPKPLKGDSVYVNYIGHTLQGKVFDTSIESVAKAVGLQQPGRTYEPINFLLGAKGVIPGWEEGLLLLNEGSKATFVIPSKLAYGANQAGPDIPAFSTLVFDVELVKVVRGSHPAAAVQKPVAKSTVKHTVAKKTLTTKKKQ
ncbi:FKBP-type peptidyl-prolyl cis-trans isomerase [Mucilaginibacter sp. UR6-11]|uniref:FKBP-type peptidyl-prolyl cis-trans isomerase n=1 Tax=Mucilaginibacter sp. UR6-11 TaxID=1435644 RepID=UPI001E29C7FC|nr:FKBP-type peptidyl-prolyl cis-trans isomerase [Mucilaginibacter sp. UR6-11]MCC8426819.1 FKBP-type peptidyl-prolyl cis-trans isomerase [Mucilaginibacter sp. UR6-11]